MCLTPKLNTYFQLVNAHAYTIKNASINLNGNMKKKTARFFFFRKTTREYFRSMSQTY